MYANYGIMSTFILDSRGIMSYIKTETAVRLMAALGLSIKREE
jgi:hypothetical protein